MTWHTPEGDRTLRGAEAEVVRDTLAVIVDRLSDNLARHDDDSSFDCGVHVFDSLTPTAQLAVVKGVAEHLLTVTSETLELTSVNEAAAYAIYRTLAAEIRIEIDIEGLPLPSSEDPASHYAWRQRTLNAFRQSFIDELDNHDMVYQDFADDDPESSWMTPRSERSRNVEQWDSLTESLADRILWDRDFEMAGDFLDTEPAKAAMMKQMLGIESDYYCSVSSDVAPDRIDQLLNSVRQITHRKPK